MPENQKQFLVSGPIVTRCRDKLLQDVTYLITYGAPMIGCIASDNHSSLLMLVLTTKLHYESQNHKVIMVGG